MRISGKIYNKIKKEVEKVYEKKDFGHNMGHINETIRLAEYIAKKEKADIDVCKTAALLHDLAKGKKDHAVGGAKMARKILTKYNLDKNFIEKVCYCILNHCNRQVLSIKEANVLYDADKLQTIGPHSFPRIFSDYFILKKMSMAKSIEMSKTEENLYVKCLKTKTARELAKEPHKCMINFYRLIDKWNKK